MLANLCVENHLRELLEQGFEVAVVKDAAAGPRHPELGDGVQSGGRQLRFPRERGPHDGRCREGHELINGPTTITQSTNVTTSLMEKGSKR